MVELKMSKFYLFIYLHLKLFKILNKIKKIKRLLNNKHHSVRMNKNSNHIDDKTNLKNAKRNKHESSDYFERLSQPADKKFERKSSYTIIHSSTLNYCPTERILNLSKPKIKKENRDLIRTGEKTKSSMIV